MSEQAAATDAVSTGQLIVRAVLRTDVGLVRSENQDFGSLTTPEEERSSHARGRLLIVADGMGGHRGGATASRLSGETVKAQYLGSETDDIAVALRDALTRANSRIFHEAQTNPDLRGMGTTTSALAIRGSKGWFAHVGDSRIYMVRGQEIRQLTEDHSLVASMVREGLLTSKEAETHPRRNVLQRSMGVAEDVDIDVDGPFVVQPGDTFILCSDGLHGLVKEDEMKEVAQLPIEQAADEYLKRALERGAPDNVTVIVARVETGPGEAEVFPEPRLDETQPMTPLPPETLNFDETQRDTTSFDETVTDKTAPAKPRMIVDPDAVTAPIPIVVVPDAEGEAITAPGTAATPVVQSSPEAIPEPAVPAPAPAAVTAAAVSNAAESEPAPETVKTIETPVPPPSDDVPGSDDTARVAPVAAAAEASSSVVRWMLIVVIVLGAAGAWLFWLHR